MSTKAKQLEEFIDGLGLPNFKGREFTSYWSRTKNGVRNSVPHESLWLKIVPTLVVLQRFRTEIGSSITLLSTYRSAAYNKAIGGAAASFHMQFMAIDFDCQTGVAVDWASILRSYRGQNFQLPGIHGEYGFHGGIGVYIGRNFVHLDTRGSDSDWQVQ